MAKQKAMTQRSATLQNLLNMLSRQWALFFSVCLSTEANDCLYKCNDVQVFLLGCVVRRA